MLGHRHKAEAFGALLIEDDLGVYCSPILAEQNHQVWVPEPEGKVGNVQPAGDVSGHPGLLVGEEEVG